MKNKIILLLILLIPSLIYFFFELTQANFNKLPHFGPKQVNARDAKDTIYYSVPPLYYKIRNGDSLEISAKQYPIYAILFIDEANRVDNYKLRGLLEYAQLKKKDVEKIPLFIVGKYDETKDNLILPDYLDSLKINENNVQQLLCPSKKFEAYRNYYLNQKPYYIMNHFIILVDNKRCVRGYYDGNYVAEVKRLKEEYEHLKLRDEHNRMEEKEKIEQR